MRVFLLACALSAIGVSAASAAELDTVLSNMDRTAAEFRGMTADVEWVKFTALVDDKAVEKGVMAVRRAESGGVDLKIDFKEPYPYHLLVKGTDVQIWRPKINTVEEYDLSKSREKLEQALLLGFGVSGSFLNENYDVTLAGEESVAGRETVKLALAPKEPSMRKSIPKLEMWVSTEDWQPVQQKLYEEGPGDYRLYVYSNIERNPSLKSDAFKLDIPKRAKRVKPQS